MRALALGTGHAVQAGGQGQVFDGGERAVGGQHLGHIAYPFAHLGRRLDDVEARHSAVPELGGSSVVSILIAVLFPAPFGPSKPNIPPDLTWKLIALTAVKLPKRRVSALVSMAGDIGSAESCRGGNGGAHYASLPK